MTQIAVHLEQLAEAQVIAASDAAGEPSLLRDRRLAAAKRYADQAWPDSHLDEFWRSTPFSRRIDVDREVVVGPADDVVVPGSLAERIEGEAALVRIVDGALVDVTVPTSLTEQGVVVACLRTAASEHPELVERHLGSLTTGDPDGTGADEDRTVTLNDAAWSAGVLVHVPAEVELDVPVIVQVHVARPGAHLPRVLAVVDHHAALDLYLEHTSTDDLDALVSEVVEVVAHDASRVRVVSLQGWSGPVQHLGLQKIQVHRDADVQHVSVTTGGATVRLRPETDLVGPGGRARPRGVYFASDGQWLDLQPYVRHLAPRATSEVLFKGALQGRSRTVFRGNVFVHKDAVGTVTDENNRTLILTEGARADATPFLEIECADIKAGHGSATGQIDARHLFYLESRGIPRDQALRLIVTGFFREVLAGLDLPGVEEAALQAIEARVDASDLSAVRVDDTAMTEAATGGPR